MNGGYTVNHQFILKRPNFWDQALAEDKEIWRRIQAQGGILAAMSPFRRKLLETGNWGDPWITMPSEGEPFNAVDSILLPANDGNDHLVLSYPVRSGYDGVITGITQFYTEPGAVPGDGSIIWRLKINLRYPNNLGNMLFPFGSLSEPYSIQGGVRIYSQQRVNYYVNIPAASALAGGRVVCGISGYVYPRQ